MNSDIEELLRVAAYRTADVVPLPAAGASPEARTKDASVKEDRAQEAGIERSPNQQSVESRIASALTIGSGDPSGLAAEVSRLAEATRTATAVNVVPPKAPTATASQSEKGAADTIIRTAAMVTGVGPLVTGIMKLFGSGEKESLPPLEKYVGPASVSVEAGLSSTREIGAIRHTQGGRSELASEPQSSRTQSPTVQVTIQALDSQSFMDRQDDIARAVREAMLHSSSLNDVVMEL